MIISTRTQTVGDVNDYCIMQGILIKNVTTGEIEIALSVIKMDEQMGLTCVKQQKLTKNDINNLSMVLYYLQSDYERAEKENRKECGQGQAQETTA
jgi:hypothetical protein